MENFLGIGIVWFGVIAVFVAVGVAIALNRD